MSDRSSATIAELLALLGALLPLLGSLLAKQQPPHVDFALPLALLAAFLGVFIAFHVGGRSFYRRKLFLGIVIFFASIFALTAYSALLRTTTVAIEIGQGPQKPIVIYEQVGFGRADWSLTSAGKQLKEDHPYRTKAEWLNEVGGPRTDAPNIIWTASSIALAELTLMLLLSFGSGLLAYSFGLVASYITETAGSPDSVPAPSSS